MFLPYNVIKHPLISHLINEPIIPYKEMVNIR